MGLMMSIHKNNFLVRDVMILIKDTPLVDEKEILKVALEKMSLTNLGIICITDKANVLLGILTDGDIRRKLLKIQKPFSALLGDDVLDHSIRSPITIEPDARLSDAVKIMGQKKIWDIPVVSANGVLVGLLHLHPAVEALMTSE
jgi:arabinose-5-phosphate isomerase